MVAAFVVTLWRRFCVCFGRVALYSFGVFVICTAVLL